MKSITRKQWSIFFLVGIIALQPTLASSGILKRRPQPSKSKTSNPSHPVDEGNLEEGTTPLHNRWKIKPPEYELNKPGHWWNPYRQNVLKGDYPLIGEEIFMVLTGTSDSSVEAKQLPIPSNASANRAGKFTFFGNGGIFALQQNFKFSFELYKGNTSFKPRDWQIKVTPVFNINYLNTNERGIVNVNVARGTSRTQTDIALQEALIERHLFNVSSYYDFVSFRGGIQPFTSDFRGLIFSDTNLSGRIFGSLNNNRIQWNLIAFDMLEKSTNSELNTFDRREQEVLIGNLYAQDFLGVPGWTNQFSVHWNHDQASTHYDINGFLVRPDPAGAASPHKIDAVYLGWTSDGHVGRFNLDHAFYYVVGKDRHSIQADQEVDISALLAAAEVSYDRDWIRLKSSVFYASGDSNPTDNTAKGFDSIFDFQQFAGGPNTFFNHEAVKLNGVNLTQKNSLLPDLRSSKTEGQSNFVNPGLLLFNVGSDLEILPELRASLNVNYLRFMTTEPLKLFLNQGFIRKDIGWDYSVGFQYRPLLNNNIILNARAALFQPLGGFKDMLTSDLLYSVSFNTVLTF